MIKWPSACDLDGPDRDRDRYFEMIRLDDLRDVKRTVSGDVLPMAPPQAVVEDAGASRGSHLFPKHLRGVVSVRGVDVGAGELLASDVEIFSQ